MKSDDGKRRRALSPEERMLWTTVTRSIAPLCESGVTGAADNATTFPSAVPSGKPDPTVTPLSEEKSSPPLVPLGRRMKRRVARGKETIDGRLDLHGLTQAQAHATLLRFLRAASSRGAQLVLVITGKGARVSDGERGVLKRQVPHWLALPEFRVLIIGFEEAHIAHGGGGALYVRMRRMSGPIKE
ncbi:MAG TPA: Smr/MutS family protein [Pseudolabrys sp.]|nr:Smr/MutS family protein [Pseudolabrys sp.]